MSGLLACLAAAIVAAPFLYLWFGKPPAQLRDYDAEKRLWQMIAGDGERIQAIVRQLSRHPLQLTKGGSFGNNEVAAVDLVLSYSDARNQEHRAVLSTFIEMALIANFSEGRAIALIRDRQDPQRVAIDREINPVEIPPARQG